MDREHNSYTNLQNVFIKSEIDCEDIDYSIVKEELEVGPTVLQKGHGDTVLCEISKFEIMDGSTNIQINNNNTFLEKLFSCDICSYKVETECQLEKHTLSHLKIKNNTKKVKHERVCNNQSKELVKKVKHKAVCNSHRVNTTWDALYTKTGKLRSYTCDQCSYRTSVRLELNRHKHIHTGRNLYECNICDYKTPFKSRHTRHQAVHSGIKSFFCNLCNYKTGTNESLTRHMSTHAQKLGISRPEYPCGECEKRFTCAASAAKHRLRVHTDKMPYWCAHCDYKANDRRKIVRHLNNHIGWKPFCCDECGLRYRASESAVRHKRKYHNDKL